MYMECRHILAKGDKCCAPALRNKAYCYFHLHNRRVATPELSAKSRPRKTDTVDLGHIPVASGPAQTPHSIPLLEDRMAVQIALTNVLDAIATNRIDAQRAGLLLYGLQIASANAKDFIGQTSSSVRSYTIGKDGEMLGPIEQGADYGDVIPATLHSSA